MATIPARYRLPLVPLPVVLFPTVSMPLRIFEPRYRRMVERCLGSDRRFGVVYHDADVLGPFLMEEGRVGCLAEIQDFQPLPDGRSLLMVRGVDRFVIVDGIESTEPFYEALVAPYPDDAMDPVALEHQRRRTLALFGAVVRGVAGPAQALPEIDVERELSFPLVRAIEVEAAWRQGFLEMKNEIRRLQRLDAVFQAIL